ncbi:hypothetical protein [Streptomyces sp. NPDC046925]|uniref:hypothetical protein n=1 Tax=Streptomyces sp. NPDC046925 TaxID=3155375 RepID=UPI0033E14BA3
MFCPGGSPWQGVLTTEQFKKLVWRQGRYDRQLQPGDKAKDAEIPPGTLTEGQDPSSKPLMELISVSAETMGRPCLPSRTFS